MCILFFIMIKVCSYRVTGKMCYRSMGGKLYFLLLCLVEPCYLKVCNVEYLAIPGNLLEL